MAKETKETKDAKAAVNEKGFNRVIGIDVANSTLKIWTEDGVNKSYRNTIKLINDAGLVYSFKTDYHMYVFNNEVYEVGDISAMGSGGRGASRYTSQNFKIEAIIGITSVLQEGTSDTIRLVTGVPSSLAKNNKVIAELKSILLGSHEVKSVSWDKVETISFDVAEVIVVPQPLGTMYNYVFDEKTKSLNTKLLDQRAIVVDIGWGTSDIAILECGRVRSTFGFEIGTSDYVSGIQEEVNTEIPDANIFSLNPHELDLRLLESPIVETPFGEYDLSKYMEKQREIQSKRIYQEVMALGLEFNKFYKIILTGGGALQYEKYLRKEFNDPRVLVKEDAVMSNARGFFLLGKF